MSVERESEKKQRNRDQLSLFEKPARQLELPFPEDIEVKRLPTPEERYIGHLKERAQEAMFDSLTGLGSRAYFTTRYPQAFENSRRTFQPLTLVVIDVNRFKDINDIEGHEAGDIAMVKVADVIKKSVRASDEAFRWGGDEFVLILPNTMLEDTSKLIERLRKNLKKAEIPHPTEELLTVSIGLAEYPKNAHTQGELFRLTDLAAKDAKAQYRRETSYWRPVLTFERPFKRPLSEGATKVSDVMANDPETGLMNRNHFMEHVRELLKKSPVGILNIKIDQPGHMIEFVDLLKEFELRSNVVRFVAWDPEKSEFLIGIPDYTAQKGGDISRTLSDRISEIPSVKGGLVKTEINITEMLR